MYLIATLFVNGLAGVLAPSPGRARVWMERAASLDHIDALNELGKWSLRCTSNCVVSYDARARRYFRGEMGTPQRLRRGMLLFERAGELGNSQALLSAIQLRLLYAARDSMVMRHTTSRTRQKGLDMSDPASPDTQRAFE